ncbi:MAG: threonine--tRNA ligase [Thermotogaceae bacterium]|jgi:threonyl-tRNA synthetase|nr:threonine--tRNA ligase [Thermotogota bacterium]NLH20445.1 threonine--tRNA ligase [Thermotogaceae bacterium]
MGLIVNPERVKIDVTPEQTFLEILKSEKKDRWKEWVAVKTKNGTTDLTRTVGEMGSGEYEIEWVHRDTTEAQSVYRHTMSHILAQAVTHIYGVKNVVLGIGPTIENGFYYDILIDNGAVQEEDLPKIEKEMERIIKENYPIRHFTLPKEEAIALMREKGQPYKVELIEHLPEGEPISFYEQGDFVDLCRGPHLSSTGIIRPFKLLSLAGAYWRGDEKNQMLQRIYGTAFPTNEALKDYLEFLEESKRRDHRRLGPQLGLFHIDTEIAAGMPFFLEKGVIALTELQTVWRKFHKEAGYIEVITPLVMHEKLWRQSGHWDHYRENMYFIEKDEQTYAVKPMNCPGHIIIYKSQARSYRELPWKMAEFGKVHRYERSGVLHGLFRVRSFTQDDAHIFMTEDDIVREATDLIHLIDRMYKVFGFEYRVDLSTRPENSMGSDELWELATESLKKALVETQVDYRINEGDGAFYGPKIDFHIKDCLGRTWQCATVQLDFQMPERFDMTYIGQDNQEHRPVMIHRTVFGSLERFMGILIEHYAGAFPSWLAPVQVSVLPIADRHNDYCQRVKETLANRGIRAQVDSRSKKINYKIRDAQLNKVPYMMVVGDKEVEEEKIALRTRNEKDLGAITLDSFIDVFEKEVKELADHSLFE